MIEENGNPPLQNWHCTALMSHAYSHKLASYQINILLIFYSATKLDKDSLQDMRRIAS